MTLYSPSLSEITHNWYSKVSTPIPTKSSGWNFRQTQLSLNLCPSSELLAEEKTKLRWFCFNHQLGSTKQKIIQSQRFYPKNTSTKHPVSMDVSNIKPLAIMILNSMDSFHASCEGLSKDLTLWIYAFFIWQIRSGKKRNQAKQNPLNAGFLPEFVT